MTQIGVRLGVWGWVCILEKCFQCCASSWDMPNMEHSVVFKWVCPDRFHELKEKIFQTTFRGEADKKEKKKNRKNDIMHINKHTGGVPNSQCSRALWCLSSTVPHLLHLIINLRYLQAQVTQVCWTPVLQDINKLKSLSKPLLVNTS